MNVNNANTLIIYLEGLAPNKFNMQDCFVRKGKPCLSSVAIPVIHECDTAACIAGWIYIISGLAVDRDNATQWLGVDDVTGHLLFTPRGFRQADRFPLRRAIATLKRLRDTYLSTGQVVVDWGPEPGEEPKTPWVAPHVAEVIAPTLPAEITSLLRPSLAKTEA